MRRYKHDCRICKYIESVKINTEWVDWYICENIISLGESIIGRFGNDGPEYWSMPKDLILKQEDHTGTSYLQHAKELITRLKAVLPV